MKLQNSPSSRTGRVKERGVALLISIVVALVVSLLGLSLTFVSIQEVRSSDAHVAYLQATYLAMAAIEIAKGEFRGRDLGSALATPGWAASYPNDTPPEPGTAAYRNPISLRAARFLDFGAGGYPTVLTTGMLTPPGGSLLGEGRYFLKVTDNRDEEKFTPGSADNPLVDSDFEVIVRAVGVVQNIPGEVVRAATGSSRANSIFVMEANFSRNVTFQVNSPFTLYAPNVIPFQSNAFFHGNSFDLDGYDHSSMSPEEIRDGHSDEGLEAGPGLATVYDNRAGGDGVPAAFNVYQNLQENQHDNIYGAESMFEPGSPDPSIRDITPEVRYSPYADAPKIFDPNYVGTFLQRLKAYANITYSGDKSISGGDPPLGTPEKPAITYVDGDLEVSGNNSGTGILVVTGTLKYRGAFTYDGIIVVIGEGKLDVAGANKAIVGGLFLANLIKNADGTYAYGVPQFTIRGNSNFYFRSSSIRMALSLLPLQVKNWKEVVPELELPSPVESCPRIG